VKAPQLASVSGRSTIAFNIKVLVHVPSLGHSAERDSGAEMARSQ
jgi:hypothetical protein